MRYVESFDGTRIAYQRTGSGAPVVFLPGINFSSEVWDLTVGALAEDCECITVDPRGHGASDKPFGSYSFDIHARDVSALVETLQLAEFTLVGWSLGGGIAIRYASTERRPSRLFLCSPAAPRFTAAADFPHGLPEDAVRGLMAQELADRPAYRRWVIEQSFHKQPSEEMLRWLCSLSVRTPSWASQACLEALIAEDLHDDLTHIEAPTCVVRGSNDGFVTEGAVSTLSERIRDCRTFEFDDSGHMAFLEETDRFNSLLREFVIDPVSNLAP